jgi:putative spermidine/putrescine transport system ATP-binding protein
MNESGTDYLVLSHVKKRFGAFQAVEDFELSAGRGEFISFLGPSGCGKTTTLRMIAGFERPDVGAISVGGRDITNLPPNKRNVGMVFQSYALFPNMTVADNIGFGMRVKRRPRGEIKARVHELLGLINLRDKIDRYPYQLSGGQQQRVALARALAVSPDVLLLDEPLSALDAKIRVALRNEIREIQRQLGITTVYVTHDQEEALSLSDRVVVMNEGRIEQIGSPFEIYNFPSTAFVASFVGTLNLLEGEVVDAPRGEVSISGQTIRVTRTFEGSAGKKVRLALRPEMASLSDRAPGSTRLAGEVVDVSFLGSIVRIRVRVAAERAPSSNGASGDGQVVMLDEFNEPGLKVPQLGDRVTVSFPMDGPLVVDAQAPVESVEALIAEA